jgi:hypothetical protein
MAIANKELSEELKEKVKFLIPKIIKETSSDNFTREEIDIIEQCYLVATGRPAPKNCGRMCLATLNLMRNYFSSYQIEELTESIVEPSNKDWNEYSLKELREMFPSIKSTSKKGFIEEIEKL